MRKRLSPYTRNGCRLRKVETQLGTLNLGIPTYCDGSSKTALFETALFEPDAQKSDRLLLPTMKLLAHASMPDTVAVFAEELCQLSLPDDILDDLVSDFAQVIHDFENRPLEQAYPYVLLAESLVHTKHTNGKAARVHLYLVVGLREDGVREVLSYRVTEEEPRFSRPHIFLELFERGLHGVHTFIAKSNIDSLPRTSRCDFGEIWQNGSEGDGVFVCESDRARRCLSFAGRPLQKNGEQASDRVGKYHA